MSTFKNKNKKIPVSDKRVTLDTKHTEMMKHFDKLKKSLPSKKRKYDILKREYNNLDSYALKDMDSESINRKFDLRDELEILGKEIENIENQTEEKKYYLNAGNLLCEYYDNVTKKDNSAGDMSIIDKMNHNKFQGDINNYIDRERGFQGAKYFNEYVKIIDPSNINHGELMIKHEQCDSCGGEKTYSSSEGYNVCESCGEIDRVVIDFEKPSYKDPPLETSYFAYKRSNHYAEFLFQMEGSFQIYGIFVK